MPDGRITNSFCIVHALTKFMQSEYCPTGSSLKLPEAATFDPENSLTLLEKFNRLGIDFWSRITFQVWLTALVEAGIGSIREYQIFPEDGEWFHGFIDDMVSRRRLGAIFADGLARALDRLQEEIPRELIDLGREIVFAYGFQAHREGRFWDREPLPYWVFSAMMYISESRDPTIGSHSLLHMAELQLIYGETALKKFRTLSSKVWNDSGALEPSFENKAHVAIWCQRMHFLIDSLTMCDFAFPKLIKYYPHERDWLDDDDIYGDLELDRRLLSAVTGVNFSRQELDAAADRGFSIERCMLARAGRTRELEEKLASHFELPCRDDGTKTSKENFLELMEQYYQARGWDRISGWPLSGTLHRLGLSDVQKEMRFLRSFRRRNSG
jgi:aldehyde:ferredoxin oxidoreductase